MASLLILIKITEIYSTVNGFLFFFQFFFYKYS